MLNLIACLKQDWINFGVTKKYLTIIVPNFNETEVEKLSRNCFRVNLIQFLNSEETGKEAARPPALEFFVYIYVLFQDYNYQ